MSEKKEATLKQKPEHEIRCGEVTASIYRRQSNTGYVYRTYELDRRWRVVGTGKESKASSLFFDTNEQDLVQAVAQASAWIRDNANGDHTAPTRDTERSSR